MSGGISFKSGEYWSAAGWAYRAVLESLCEELSHNNRFELFEELSEENCSAKIIEFIESEDWTNERVAFFCTVIKRAYDRTKSKGSIDWSNPIAFDGFISHYEKLAELAEKEYQKYG